MSTDNNVMHNEAEQRYEVTVGDQIAVLSYTRNGDKITYLHTVVPVALEGRGIGSSLARKALEDARIEGLKVVPVCSFISSYIEKHPEYQSLL